MLSDNYKCIQGYECLAGCISNYFNHYNIGLNESDIFLCGYGFKVEYSGDLQYLRIGAKAYDANKKFIKRYDIPCERGYIPERIAAKEFIEYCISKDIPLIVRVDTENLSYHNVYHNSPPSPHWINVVGKCDNGYIISDCAIPALKREKAIAPIIEEELLLSWSKKRYEYIVLSKEKLYLIDVERIKHDSEKKLYSSFQEYLRPKKKWFSSTKQGVDAVMAMLDDMVAYNWESSDELDFRIREINYQVKLNGLISHRYVIKMKLEELKYSETLLNSIDEIADRWNNLFFKLLRVGMTGKIKELEKIRDEACAISEQEREAIHVILN